MDRAKNIFDRIGSLIPGYRGYAEREGRRNCDKILRDSIVEKLIYCEKNLYELMTESLNQKDKFKLNELEVVRKQINTFISKIKYAPHGVTSFFADNQIKEDDKLDNKTTDTTKLQELLNKANTPEGYKAGDLGPAELYGTKFKSYKKEYYKDYIK